MRMGTKEAANKLNMTQKHVSRLIRDGYIKAIKLGRDYIIEAKHLKKIKRRRSKKGTRKSNA